MVATAAAMEVEVVVVKLLGKSARDARNVRVGCDVSMHSHKGGREDRFGLCKLTS